MLCIPDDDAHSAARLCFAGLRCFAGDLMYFFHIGTCTVRYAEIWICGGHLRQALAYPAFNAVCPHDDDNRHFFLCFGAELLQLLLRHNRHTPGFKCANHDWIVYESAQGTDSRVLLRSEQTFHRFDRTGYTETKSCGFCQSDFHINFHAFARQRPPFIEIYAANRMSSGVV